jgi:hypothetical protein
MQERDTSWGLAWFLNFHQQIELLFLDYQKMKQKPRGIEAILAATHFLTRWINKAS